MIAFAEKEEEWMPHLALVHKSCDITAGPVLTRVHSECITGDLFWFKTLRLRRATDHGFENDC